MKKAMFIMGYFAIVLSTFGMLFKLMHWPGANIMLIIGIALFNLGFLPSYCTYKFKSGDKAAKLKM